MLKNPVILCVLLLVSLIPVQVFAQEGSVEDIVRYFREPGTSNRLVLKIPAATGYTIYIADGICQKKDFLLLEEVYAPVTTVKVNTAKTLPAKSPLFKVRGNVLYDYVYNSGMDTPFVQKDFQQHTIQTTLDITYKNTYPVRLSFSNRFSNSPYFKNFNDINLQFNTAGFRKAVLERLKNQLQQKLLQETAAQSARLQNRYGNLENQIANLKGWLAHPERVQELVEEKEEKYLGAAKGKVMEEVDKRLPDSSFEKISNLYKFQRPLWKKKQPSYKEVVEQARPLADSLLHESKQAVRYKQQKQKLDSLTSEMGRIRDTVKSIEAAVRAKTANAVDKINNIKNGRDVTSVAKELGVSRDSLPKGNDFLLGLKKINLGFAPVNYSELSAKNIVINGFQAEYNDRLYAAIAVGTINYRFRDFVLKDYTPQKQYLFLARAGIGSIDNKSIVFTYYTGKKQAFNSFVNVSNTTDAINIMGFTLEARYRISRKAFLTLEAAKSSKPYLQNVTTDKITGIANFKDRSNEAYAARLTGELPKTATRFDAYYKRFGTNFQSFTLFSTNASQNAWEVKGDQPLFKKTLTLSAGMRVYDFSNPYVIQMYKNNTVFKSVQATFRKRKWPTASVGYYPSSQLFKIDNQTFSENLFYTLNSSLSHSYLFKNIAMSSFVSYYRFYNKSADSSFIYSNSKNYLASQNINLAKLGLTTNFTYTDQASYYFKVWEQQVQYQLRQSLAVGGGLKYITQRGNLSLDYWGQNAFVRLSVKKLGDFQLQYDKSYIPGLDNKLKKNEQGRLTYYVNF